MIFAPATLPSWDFLPQMRIVHQLREGNANVNFYTWGDHFTALAGAMASDLADTPSRTDPQGAYMVRDGKPKGFFYLDHRTVDGRLGIITGDRWRVPGLRAVLPGLGLFTARLVALDRSKFRAVASAKRVIGRREIAEETARLDRRIADYLAGLDESDTREPDEAPSATAAALEALRTRRAELDRQALIAMSVTPW